MGIFRFVLWLTVILAAVVGEKDDDTEVIIEGNNQNDDDIPQQNDKILVTKNSEPGIVSEEIDLTAPSLCPTDQRDTSPHNDVPLSAHDEFNEENHLTKATNYLDLESKNEVPRRQLNETLENNASLDDNAKESPIETENKNETTESENENTNKEEAVKEEEEKITEQENEIKPTESTDGINNEVATPANDYERCPFLWPECADESIINATEQVTKAITSFSVELYKTLSNYDTRPNLVVAPVSIALTLSHLMLGTGKTTRDFMLRNLFKGVTDTQCVHKAMTNMFNESAFLRASEIFYKKGISLNYAFVNQSLKYYESGGQELRKDPKASMRLINKWVSKKTSDHIPELLEELPSDLQLLLVNVLYYQGKWLTKFDSKLTKKESFNLLDSKSVKVPMMNNHKYQLQLMKDKHLKAQVARFPLTNNISFIVILPQSEPVEAVAQRLTGGVVPILIKQLQEVTPRSTSVSLPHLKLDSPNELAEVLSKLDLDNLFYNSNLCGISTQSDLAVSEVHHRAVFEVTEEGVAAAAASAVSVARTMNFFTVRKPFLFILASDITMIPIFIGHVKDPSQ